MKPALLVLLAFLSCALPCLAQNDAPLDYNRDGRSDYAVFYPPAGSWYILYSRGAGTTNIPWGFPGATPLPGDYNGDGYEDLAVYYNGTWYIREVDGTILAWAYQWGWPGAIPVVGDFDGDHKDDLAVFDQNSGHWYIRSLATGKVLAWALQWGFPGGVPLGGDYDRDGTTDLYVIDHERNLWYVYSLADRDMLCWNCGPTWSSGANPEYLMVGMTMSFNCDAMINFDPVNAMWRMETPYTGGGDVLSYWGYAGVLPIIGDFDGDGYDDTGVYDPNSGAWYILANFGTRMMKRSWGFPGAVPLTRQTRGPY